MASNGGAQASLSIPQDSLFLKSYYYYYYFFMSVVMVLLQRAVDAETSLEKIKRQLASGSGRNLLQGPLLKRSETVWSVDLFFN